jgi:hypothetical protein
MKRTALVFVSALLAAFSGCSDGAKQPPPKSLSKPTSFSASSPTSSVIAAANDVVLKAGLNWGEPVKVEWLGLVRHYDTDKEPTVPVNRWQVRYATPDSELGWAGFRQVGVETNGYVWIIPRG